MAQIQLEYGLNWVVNGPGTGQNPLIGLEMLSTLAQFIVDPTIVGSGSD